MGRDDDELRTRYTHAWVSVVRSRAQAREARRRGDVDDLAELQIAVNQGRAAAAVWLRGASPLTPVTRRPGKITPTLIALELHAAQELAAGPDLYVGELPESYDGDPRWAAGVADLLQWQLVRPSSVAV